MTVANPTRLRHDLVKAAGCLARSVSEVTQDHYLDLGRELVSRLPAGTVGWNKEGRWLNEADATAREEAGDEVVRIDSRFLPG